MIDEKKIEEGIQHIMSHQVSWYGCQIPDDDYDNKYYHQKEVINIARSSINWFKENLWHDASEEPKMYKGLLVEYQDKSVILLTYSRKGTWNYIVNRKIKKRWLYIEDLMKGGE